MAETIHKYSLAIIGPTESIPMPEGAVVLSAGIQRNILQVWAICDPDKPLKPRQFVVVGTGWELPYPSSELAHICTVMIHDGGFVWHLFERTTQNE